MMRPSRCWIALLLGAGAVCWGHATLAAPEGEAGSTARAADSEPRFAILEYRVTGVSKLPAIEVERAVYPFLGEGRTVKDALSAVSALQAAYHKAGFQTVVVDLPPQKVEGGVVIVRVTEGSIGRVRVTGARYYSLGWIKAQVASVEPGTVPSFPKVQAELGGLNRSDDLKVAPVLKPGSTPGTVDVELKVADQLPLHGDVDLNDRYSAHTSRLRLSGALRYDNVSQTGQSAGLQFQTSPENTGQVRLLTGSYVVPLGADGKSLTAYAVHSRSRVATAGDLIVLGNGDIFGLRYALPLVAAENEFRSLNLGIDYKRFSDDYVFGTTTTPTPVRYTPLMLQYAGASKDATGSGSYAAGVVLGSRGPFGSSDTDFSNTKRRNASASFAALKADVNRIRTLMGDWSVSGKLEGQYASGPLITNEQFTAGGAETVRGYDEAEVFGDDGLRAGVELRHVLPSRWIGAPVAEFYGLMFYDAATLRNKDVEPGQTSRFNVASTGFGLRMKIWKTLRLALDVAYPLRDGPVTHAGEVRTHFDIDYGF